MLFLAIRICKGIKRTMYRLDALFTAIWDRRSANTYLEPALDLSIPHNSHVSLEETVENSITPAVEMGINSFLLKEVENWKRYGNPFESSDL